MSSSKPTAVRYERRFRISRVEIPAEVWASFEVTHITSPDGEVFRFVRDRILSNGTVVGHLVRGGQ